ncbi:uncharacterized protein RAG0_04133 [Rhynchosporium agropyri]|uniref:Uncharacterized protein n=1 Tax=Rhynchosporium agropyri TaxID=914238 RepID=A0A1E1K7N9_9HELO|nr:uncharacterized protein RAG0_04133 [Rhynchosporium agropyri]
MTAWQSEQAHDLIPLQSEPQAFRNALKPVQSALFSEKSTDDCEPPLFRHQTTRQKYFGGMIPKISKTQGPPNGAHVDPFDVAIAVERLQTMVELYSNMQNEASTWERLENK